MNRASTANDREKRIELLRQQALETGRARGAGIRPAGAPFPVASPDTGYYGVPLLKRPTWTWEVPLYFFVGGAAGASAVIGSAARLAGKNGALARDARLMAALGGMISPVLLMSDLKVPSRFLNMLRIFKPQSPMSIGAWTLVAFSSSAAAAAIPDRLGRELRDRLPVRILAAGSGLSSAATGLVMTTYTGVLLGATTIPVWSRNASILPVEFGASALGSAVSLLELRGHRSGALQALGIGAAAAESAVGFIHESRRDPEMEPAHRGRAGLLIRAAGVLSGPLALALRLSGRRKGAAVATLVGSLLLRYGWVSAGRVSADDARGVLKLGR